ncbi:hypothetical protein [Streptomyces sp. NPDC048481]|uniref:hypothetical protein n=1 Tax=Streptomyces sp. NPDC048481 TaxID=3365557 RepID=UPI0037192991
MATAVATAHSFLAWFMGDFIPVLAPALRWLPAADGVDTGEESGQIRDAEKAFIRLRLFLIALQSPGPRTPCDEPLHDPVLRCA